MSFALSEALAGARKRGWPLVMGILNVTPDSFSDGGRFRDARAAIDHALEMERDGADLIDVGGESTRPGAAAVGVGDELSRVIPVIEGLRARSAIAVSIDTSKPAVMAAALAAGADLVNDVRALSAPGALEVARGAAAVVLMHMKGEPRTMQRNPSYADVVTEVRDFLAARAHACRGAGFASERLVIDPGIGFGKTLEHNLALLKRLDVLVATGFPVLVGASRKSMLAAITGRSDRDRRAASLAVALWAARAGCAAVRVHDVAETVDGLRVWARLEEAR